MMIIRLVMPGAFAYEMPINNLYDNSGPCSSVTVGTASPAVQNSPK